MASFLQVSLKKPSINISSPTYVIHASLVPSSLILINRKVPGEKNGSLSFWLGSLFSPPALPRPSYGQISPSAPYCQTSPYYILLPLWHTKYHNQYNCSHQSTPAHYYPHILRQQNIRRNIPYRSVADIPQFNLFLNSLWMQFRSFSFIPISEFLHNIRGYIYVVIVSRILFVRHGHILSFIVMSALLPDALLLLSCVASV
jgi:hypothetical protein